MIEFAKELYEGDSIALHRPVFSEKHKEMLSKCVDSNYVSSAGPEVAEFEKRVAEYVGARFAVATASGTSALHIGLCSLGIKSDCEVITQALTFVATANAISYCGATPIFLDVDQDTLSLCPVALAEWLDENALIKDGFCVNKCK